MEIKPPDQEPDIKHIISKCLDSPGYVLFAAVLSPLRDKDGRAIINHEYRRYHFPLEDSKAAVDVLKGFVDKEIADLIKSYDRGGDQDAEGPGT